MKGALKLCLEERGVLCKTVTEALELVFDYDEREKQMFKKEHVCDGLQQPKPEGQVRRWQWNGFLLKLQSLSSFNISAGQYSS